MTSSLGLINLLEWLTELREMFYLLGQPTLKLSEPCSFGFLWRLPYVGTVD